MVEIRYSRPLSDTTGRELARPFHGRSAFGFLLSFPASSSLAPGYREGMAFDALVLLGCRVASDVLPGPARRRVLAAAAGFSAGLAPRVAVTGGKRWGATIEAEELARALTDAGVPRDAILLERASTNTFENARFTAKMLLPLGFTHVGLVTCDWHLPRALWNFRQAGLQAEPLPAVSPEIATSARALRAFGEHAAFLHDRAVALVC
jgi:uncharacterized SAM-binding protein YcdF (DUF218 family)